MHFHDDSLFPENQEKLVIQAAPYGPEWLPGDADDLPLTMDEHVQAAVDCYDAGATVLHIHVRELDGKGSKRMSMFNELLGRLREAVPDMVLQIGGSISFAPEGEGGDAKWLAYDTRHLLADLTPAPDQVTIAINTSQMNIVEIMTDDDLEGTSIAKPDYYRAYRDMVVEAGPDFYLEHLKRLQGNGIQPHFQLATLAQLETVERLIRAGIHTGPLILNYVAIGGGFAGRHPADLIEFVRRVPDGAVLTIESSMRAVAPMNAIAIALGVHVRVGNEDNLWRRKGERMSSVEQVEQMVQIANALGRDIATGAEAKEIYKIGEYYADADETLARLGMVPNRRPGQRGFMLRDSAS
ncbi:3-keto-5-aminohexanoate cleavage protein [Streptomyces nojiriensis]|uniref:3-keto-5-aminohexanoate cleavage protein n=3 Tax=Streptomyces nojiriensis TaxID=66374 RepID=A0ABQ3SI95_9ACTN|nr:3-keto-5-aminohexanoate cleavage protein [Streptomyces nojiriensis]QTI49481.1 3-keto-5-aminohexanoate cleavage enzyme [Streptomyces nojiriensis]GGS35184.1 3-keto-5-aminohexanoate cleavage protein [Streptomyces nojiriensis]GHI67863.1 3-keto-5-aminohexanoate cleavage protein [Streptomyces nojiriensis]